MFQFFIYFILHSVAGILIGYGFYKLHFEKLKGVKAYLLYVAVLVLFLAIAAAIGELSNYWAVNQTNKYIGAIASLVSCLISVRFVHKYSKR